MRAWRVDSYEGAERLRFGEVVDPQPGPGQVAAAGKVRGAESCGCFLAQAMYPARPTLPHILGRDAVGEVLAVASRTPTCSPDCEGMAP